VASLGDLGSGSAHNCLGKTAGQKCIIECAYGYSGDPTVRFCENNGDFSGIEVPTCEANPCTKGFPNGLGVSHTCSGIATGGSCEAACAQGYSGSSTQFTCRSDGEVFGSAPACIAKACGELSLDVQYDSELCSGKTTSQTCLVGCSEGWSLVGSVTSYECKAVGSFSGSLPECAAKRCTEGVPSSSDLNTPESCSSLTTGQMCSVVCADGYEGGVAEYTCGTSGYLTGSLPTCTLKVCPNSLPLGKLSNNCGDGVTFSSSCIVACADGYRLEAGSSSQQWQCAWDDVSAVVLQGTLPQCEPVPCEYNFPSGAKFVHNCTGIGTGFHCLVGCAPGFAGSCQALICQADKSLHGTPPTCEPLPCPSRNVVNVVNDCGSTKFGGRCFASCADGFSGTPTFWSCGLDGQAGVQLQGDAPTCEALTCIYNIPVGLAFAHVCENLKTGETCTVSCADGFVYAAGVESPTVLTCDAAQSLAGSLPECLLITITTTKTSSTQTATTTSMETSTSTTLTSTTSTATSTVMLTVTETTTSTATPTTTSSDTTTQTISATTATTTRTTTTTSTTPTVTSTSATPTAQTTTSTTATTTMTESSSSTSITTSTTISSTSAAAAITTKSELPTDMATSITAAAAEAYMQLSGEFTLEVDEADVQSFVNDPQVREALVATVADISGAPPENIELDVSIAGRRLQAPLPDVGSAPRRHLAAAASVLVAYVVVVPKDDAASAPAAGSVTGSSSSVEEALASMSIGKVGRVLATNLEARVGAGTYTVVVQSVSAVETKELLQMPPTSSAGSSAGLPPTVPRVDAAGTGDGGGANGTNSASGGSVMVILCVVGAVACVAGVSLRLVLRRSRRNEHNSLPADDDFLPDEVGTAMAIVPEPDVPPPEYNVVWV